MDENWAHALRCTCFPHAGSPAPSLQWWLGGKELGPASATAGRGSFVSEDIVTVSGSSVVSKIRLR